MFSKRNVMKFSIGSNFDYTIFAFSSLFIKVILNFIFIKKH